MKKIITTLSIFMIVSCNTYKTSYTPVELAIANVEDYIEWLNEDLFQGNITKEQYDLMKETYEETLTLLKK
jgi:hypothetical protein